MLSEVLEEHRLKSDGTSQVHSVSLSKGIVPQIEHLGRSFAADDTTHYGLVRPFDVVYTRSPLSNFRLGIVKQHKGADNAIVSPLYGVFTPRNPHLGRLIEAYFDSPSRSIQFLDPLAQKGAKNTIQLSNDGFLSGAINLPEDGDEQQKIADCLGSLDELIAVQGQKLAALRRYKQGLLQQLFPQEGETAPRLRFPEFRDAGAWDEMRIGDLEPFVTSGSRGWAAYYSPSGPLFVRITNLSRESIYLDLTEAKFVALPTDTSEGSRTALKNGDVLISITADIGIIGYVDENVPSPAYINQHIALVRFDDPRVRSRFVAYFLASEVAQRQFRSSTDSGAKAGMNLSGVQSMSLLLPHPVEQQRIADCLASLDAIVIKQANKLDALKKHKQGLQQHLFPVADGESI